jgi:hypothetical protein
METQRLDIPNKILLNNHQHTKVYSEYHNIPRKATIVLQQSLITTVDKELRDFEG